MICIVSGVFEVAPAFLGVEEGADVADGAPVGVIGACLGFSKQGLEFGEGHLDGIEIGRVFGQEQDPGAPLGKSFCRPRALVDIEIVEDDHIARYQARRQLGADLGIEGRAVHSPVDDPRGDEAIAAQARDEGLRVPLAEGASAISRSPRGLRPRKGVMLVFTLVSSMKTSRPGWRRMKG